MYYKMDNNENIMPRRSQYTSSSQQESSKYFKLIEFVGTNGKYQKTSLIVWCILWLTTGTILLGTPFFMLNQPYKCDNHNITITNNTQNISLTKQQCQQFVCSLAQENRKEYLDTNLITISNSFVDLHCGKEWINDLLSSIVYMGCFFGYISISIMVDNIGRKRAMLISYGIATLGMILLVFAPNLYVVGIGLFLMGYGSDSAINICFYFITEMVQTKARQKYSIFIQVFFCLGGIVNVGYFYIFKNWKIIIWIFLITPSIICIAIVFKIIKDTPYFLIRLQKTQKIMEDLQSIHKLNYGFELSPQKQQEIKQYIKNLQLHHLHHNETQQKQANKNQTLTNQSPQKIQHKHHHKVYTPLDLFRYPSIRFISIAICILSAFIYLLYYGPLMLMSKLSFSLYINALVVTASELVTYPFSYFLIEKIPRQKIGYILYGISGVSSFILIFVIANLCQDETGSSGSCNFLKVLELFLIFVFRFCTSLEFAIFLIYCNEILPTQVRGLGIGISSALGTVASTASPYIFGSKISTNSATSKIMIVFVVISSIGFALWCKLPETLGRPIEDQIKQIAQGQGFQNEQGGKHIQLVQVKQSD